MTDASGVLKNAPRPPRQPPQGGRHGRGQRTARRWCRAQPHVRRPGGVGGRVRERRAGRSPRFRVQEGRPRQGRARSRTARPGNGCRRAGSATGRDGKPAVCISRHMRRLVRGNPPPKSASTQTAPARPPCAGGGAKGGSSRAAGEGRLAGRTDGARRRMESRARFRTKGRAGERGFYGRARSLAGYAGPDRHPCKTLG